MYAAREEPTNELSLFQLSSPRDIGSIWLFQPHIQSWSPSNQFLSMSVQSWIPLLSYYHASNKASLDRHRIYIAVAIAAGERCQMIMTISTKVDCFHYSSACSRTHVILLTDHVYMDWNLDSILLSRNPSMAKALVIQGQATMGISARTVRTSAAGLRSFQTSTQASAQPSSQRRPKRPAARPLFSVSFPSKSLQPLSMIGDTR